MIVGSVVSGAVLATTVTAGGLVFFGVLALGTCYLGWRAMTRDRLKGLTTCAVLWGFLGVFATVGLAASTQSGADTVESLLLVFGVSAIGGGTVAIRETITRPTEATAATMDGPSPPPSLLRRLAAYLVIAGAGILLVGALISRNAGAAGSVGLEAALTGYLAWTAIGKDRVAGLTALAFFWAIGFFMYLSVIQGLEIDLGITAEIGPSFRIALGAVGAVVVGSMMVRAEVMKQLRAVQARSGPPAAPPNGDH